MTGPKFFFFLPPPSRSFSAPVGRVEEPWGIAFPFFCRQRRTASIRWSRSFVFRIYLGGREGYFFSAARTPARPRDCSLLRVYHNLVLTAPLPSFFSTAGDARRRVFSVDIGVTFLPSIPPGGYLSFFPLSLRAVRQRDPHPLTGAMGPRRPVPENWDDQE